MLLFNLLRRWKKERVGLLGTREGDGGDGWKGFFEWIERRMHNGCLTCEQRRRKWMLIRVDRTSLSVQADWSLCWLQTHVLKPYRIIPSLLSLHVAATSQEHYSTVKGYEATIPLL